MSFRNSETGESLDLLLDTLCNTFAALVFIAILLVIINRDATAPKNQSMAAVDEARIELLQRQIANLSSEVARLSSRLDATGRDSSTDRGNADLESVKEEIQRLEARARALEAALASGQKRMNEGAKNDVQELRVLADQIAAELARIETANNASQREIERLGGELDTVNKQLSESKAPLRETYRLPKEQDNGGKTGSFVFVRGGKVYPVYFFNSSGSTRNQETIRWREDGDNSIPELIPGLGWSHSPTSGTPLARFLESVPSQRYYLSFLVWPDSFAEFRAVKQECTRRGIELGFEVKVGPLPIFVPPGRGTGPAPRL